MDTKFYIEIDNGKTLVENDNTNVAGDYGICVDTSCAKWFDSMTDAVEYAEGLEIKEYTVKSFEIDKEGIIR